MVKVSRLPPSRWKSYKKLRLESLKMEPAAFGSSYEEEARLPEGVWRERTGNCLFALSKGEPIGMVSLMFDIRPKTRHVARVFGFYVTPAHRGKGVGSMLVDAALASARANRGVRKVSLSVNPACRPALSIYQRAGFRVVGRAEGELKVGRKYHDLLNMELKLRGRPVDKRGE